MKNMNKWTTWYNSLPAHTKESLKTHPVWHDRDIVKFAGIALVVGFFLGYIS
jgi:hypothetical protein